MHHIKLWGEINEIYKNTNRGRILKKRGYVKLFYTCMVIYAAVSISAFFLKGTFFFTSVFLIFSVAMAISTVFDYALSKDYAEELNGHPFFAKAKYIKFIEFKKLFESSESLSIDSIPALLEWEDIRAQRFDTINFFTNPVTLVVISAFLSQIFSSISGAGKNVELLVVISYFFMAVMFISWTAYDFLSSDKKRNFEICRLLRWLQIENNSRRLEK